jgi:DtxR family transcriptional regulator, Mn-dependent transcriptional regulator
MPSSRTHGAPDHGHHPAVEQYLETILELEESGILPLRARLVERLGVTAPAVSETVKRLEREGYVTLDDERVLHLTVTGREYATAVLRRHRLAELLLVDVLKVPWSQVHEEACRLEHAISDNLEEHLVKLLGDPGMCPHGNPIPGSANVVDHGVLTTLSSVPVGQQAVVRRIDEHLQTQVEIMRELEHGRILPGQQVTVLRADEDGMSVDVKGTAVDLSGPTAAELYVSTA